MRLTCDTCERLGVCGWETCSASSGDNISTVFELCISAALESRVKTENKKRRLVRPVRPRTLKLSPLITKFDRNNVSDLSHLYEDPEQMSDQIVRVTDTVKMKTRPLNHPVITRQCSAVSSSSPAFSADTPLISVLRTNHTDQSALFSPQSTQSCLKSPSSTHHFPYSPTTSDLDKVPMR